MIDILLLLLIIACAVAAIEMKDLLASSVLLGAYSLLMAVVWTRMNAVDVFGEIGDVGDTGDVGVVEEPAKEALNGAQIASLVEVTQSVSAGSLAPESAKEVLRVAFPTLSDAEVNAIIDPAVNVDISEVE